eukprot:TCONS_00003065-protein
MESREYFKSLKVVELKNYLRLRGLKVSGVKDDLVARAFVAAENKSPVVKTAEEVQSEIKTEYEQKLLYEGKTLPDPFKLETGWLNEEDGVVFWPKVPMVYIIKFCMLDDQAEDLSDYKASKGYSFFKQGWLGKLFYHPISKTSDFCFIKADCRRSQKINSLKHNLWILFSKFKGRVLRAHCTCMGGMISTCNHVSAALFRLETALRLGLSNPACTATPNDWLPNRSEVTPCKISNMNLNRDDIRKRGKKQQRKLLATSKKNYKPICDDNDDGGKILNFNSVIDSLGDMVYGTTLCMAIPKPEIDFVREVISKKPVIENPPISVDDVLMMSQSKKVFFENLKANVSAASVATIEKITHGQSDNPLWYDYRKGVISASKVHQVKHHQNSQGQKWKSRIHKHVYFDSESIRKCIYQSRLTFISLW